MSEIATAPADEPLGQFPFCHRCGLRMRQWEPGGAYSAPCGNVIHVGGDAHAIWGNIWGLCPECGKRMREYPRRFVCEPCGKHVLCKDAEGVWGPKEEP